MLTNEVMPRQSWKIGCVYKTPFHKFGHIYGGIKYVNLIEIGLVVIEVQAVENSDSDLVVVGNNTLVCHTYFLATDTQPCVLMEIAIANS